MPIKVRTLKGNTTISWSNEDQTTAASWTIKKESTEFEAWETLTKATVFIGRQIGQMPDTTTLPMTKTASAMPAGSAVTSPPGTLSPEARILMTPMNDGAPAGGAPVTGFGEKFWEGMPTTVVPGNLAPSWEMDVSEGWE